MVRLLRFVPIMKIYRLQIIRVTTRLLRFQRRARPRSPSPLRLGTFLLRGSRGRAAASEALRSWTAPALFGSLCVFDGDSQGCCAWHTRRCRIWSHCQSSRTSFLSNHRRYWRDASMLLGLSALCPMSSPGQELLPFCERSLQKGRSLRIRWSCLQLQARGTVSLALEFRGCSIWCCPRRRGIWSAPCKFSRSVESISLSCSAINEKCLAECQATSWCISSARIAGFPNTCRGISEDCCWFQSQGKSDSCFHYQTPWIVLNSSRLNPQCTWHHCKPFSWYGHARDQWPHEVHGDLHTRFPWS